MRRASSSSHLRLVSFRHQKRRSSRPAAAAAAAAAASGSPSQCCSSPSRPATTTTQTTWLSSTPHQLPLSGSKQEHECLRRHPPLPPSCHLSMLECARACGGGGAAL